MKLKMTFLASLTTHVLLAQWNPLPMYGGGFITDLVPHPVNVNTLVATCDVGGLFITTNDCVTWTSLTANVPKTDGDNFKVRSFAFDPVTPTTMYYLSGNAPEVAKGKIWKTTNNGTTWTSKDLPIGVAGNNAGRSAGATILGRFFMTTIRLSRLQMRVRVGKPLLIRVRLIRQKCNILLIWLRITNRLLGITWRAY
jgi:hypothetical protein